MPRRVACPTQLVPVPGVFLCQQRKKTVGSFRFSREFLGNLGVSANFNENMKPIVPLLSLVSLHPEGIPEITS